MDSESKQVTDTVLNVEDIMRMLPHRHPMLLVDRIVDLVPETSATGIKNVTANEPYFPGHFPERPVMPGVMIIESMAQTAAALIMWSIGEELEGKLVYFMSIDSARFRKPVMPGDRLEVHVEAKQHRGPVWKFAGEGKVGGQVVAEATFTAMIVDD